MAFKDHFSSHAEVYRAARPTYPTEVFEWMARQAVHHRLAVDVGTGNGQAALGLAAYFEDVLATDASAEQVAQSMPNKRVRYEVAPAEIIPANSGSAALLLAAQAAHWFDLPGFFAEAERVLSPGGLLVLMSYGAHHVHGESGDVINDSVQMLYEDTLGPYWPPERELVESGYATFTLPFEPVVPPPFQIRVQWSLNQLLAYLESWSATQRYIKATGEDPIAELRQNLAPFVPTDTLLQVVWPLNLRCSRKVMG